MISLKKRGVNMTPERLAVLILVVVLIIVFLFLIWRTGNVLPEP
jgi:preprotein translocase subunit YajC